MLSTRSASPESKRERTRLPWEEIRQAVRPWIPFTALNTVWRHLCMYSAKMRVFRAFSNREMGRPHSMVSAG